MKKKYIAPSEKMVDISCEGIIAGSNGGGITAGSSLGNAFNDDDVSYTKEITSKNLWDTEW